MLIAVSFVGLFLGGAIGHVLGVLCAGENPHVMGVALGGLTSATLFLQYSLGGFAAIALSYFKTFK